ncbi:MAG: hypothetical protein WBK91_06565 [Alphaproteobacteria bacterium]
MLPSIPFADIRATCPKKLLRDHSDRGHGLVIASRHTLGWFSELLCRTLMPKADQLSREWLVKTCNPYLHEIDDFAAHLGIPGIHALNLCFEWGCTSAVYATPDAPTLTRALDWTFPQLGARMVIAQQRGSAGDFYNVTWPGMSGMFQGMAPGRFAAALNQAPMQRHGLAYIGDWVHNRKRMFHATGLPPAHLLRQVFETAPDYATACHMLATTPIALPVIYTLAGINPGAGCVIERTENEGVIRPLEQGRVCAANHFVTRLHSIGHGWWPRPFRSIKRQHLADTLAIDKIGTNFDWFRFPVANSHTRLAFIAQVGKGTFSVMGTEGTKPVTQIWTLNTPSISSP